MLCLSEFRNVGLKVYLRSDEKRTCDVGIGLRAARVQNAALTSGLWAKHLQNAFVRG
jgi:hypothetical protein